LFILDLNGLFRPKISVKICESDISCGGFTFKGTASSSGKQKFQTNFFHFFQEEFFGKNNKKRKQFYHWTSYKVRSRKFVKLPKKYKIGSSNVVTDAVCLEKR
jgi:hypothetical protein